MSWPLGSRDNRQISWKRQQAQVVARATVMPFCPRCGKELPRDARFCLECGASVTASAPSPALVPAKPASKTARNIVTAVALIALLLAVGGIVYFAEKISTSSTFTFVEQSSFIEYGSAWHSSTVFQEGTSIDVMTRVEEGGPIDVLLMDSKNFLDFQEFMERETTSFYYFKTGSALNVKHISFTFTFPSTDRYFIVLSNAGGIEGGARPVGDVTVYIKVIVHM